MTRDETAGSGRLTGAPTAAAIGVITVLAVSAALRLPWVAAERFWFDEVFSVVVASQEVGELLRRVIADETNPPGFYLLLGAWVRLGGFDEAWVRTLTAIIGALTPLALTVGARAGGIAWRPAIVAGLLAAGSPMLIEKSIDVRAYAPLALLATLAMGLALWMWRRRERIPYVAWFALATLGVALVATHYFGALTIAALVVATWLATRERLMPARFVLVGTPAALALGAWLVIVARATADARFGENASWIAEPSLASVPPFTAQYVGAFGSPAFAWLLVALVLRALAWAVFESRDRLVHALTAMVLVPLVLALLIGWAVGQPLWVSRYLIATAPPLLLVVSLAIERARERFGQRVGLAVATFAVGWATLAGLHAHGSGPRKPDWPAIVTALTREGPSVACVNEGYVGLGLEYYALRDRVPLEVHLMRDCGASTRPTWVVYRPGTEGALGDMIARGARLGPRFSLVTEMPVTEARRVDWISP